MQKAAYGTLLFLLLSLVEPSAAFAYLDPGSGSMLLQLVLGGLAGLAVIAKLYWHRLLGLFGMNSDQEQSEAETDSASVTTSTISEPSDRPQQIQREQT